MLLFLGASFFYSCLELALFSTSLQITHHTFSSAAFCHASVLPLPLCAVFSRTLTHVHEMILEDLVYPAEIVGKRIRIKLDGSRLIKVHLDKAQQTNIEHKVGPPGGSRVLRLA